LAEKLSKTARSSLTDKSVQFTGKYCPTCSATAMVATKVIKSEGRPGGMYWICPKCELRLRI